MYQIDIFDKFGAILARFSFQTWFGAMTWMVKHRTGKIVSDMGTVIKAPVEWKLSRIDMKMHRKLLHIATDGTVGQPWLKGATEEYHRSRSQARRLAHQRKAGST